MKYTPDREPFVLAPKLRRTLRAIAGSDPEAYRWHDEIGGLARRLLPMLEAEKTCENCGRPFFGASSHATTCSRPCKDRARRAREGAGSLERRLNQRDAQFLRRDSLVIPGASLGFDPERRVVRFLDRFVVRCAECGARDGCDCGAPRRLLPTWDGGLHAATTTVEPEKLVNLTRRHRMLLPDRSGRRYRNMPGTWRADSTPWLLPEDDESLRGEIAAAGTRPAQKRYAAPPRVSRHRAPALRCLVRRSAQVPTSPRFAEEFAP